MNWFTHVPGLTVKTGARTGENYHFGAEDLGSDAVEVKANGAPEPKAAKKTTKIGTSTYFALNAYDGEATKCFAVHDNTEYEIYPNMTLPNAEREYSECSFTLKSTDWQHAGPWTIKGSFVDDNSNETTPSEFSTDYELTVYKVLAEEIHIFSNPFGVFNTMLILSNLPDGSGGTSFKNCHDLGLCIILPLHNIRQCRFLSSYQLQGNLSYILRR